MGGEGSRPPPRLRSPSASPSPALRLRLCSSWGRLPHPRSSLGPPHLQGALEPATLALHVTLRLRAASGSEVKRCGAAWVMVQLRPRVSRTPASASAMVDEGQPASEEEAEHGLLLGQPSSGAAAEPLQDDEEGDSEFDEDEAPEELTFSSAQAEAREEERRVRETVRRFGARGRP